MESASKTGLTARKTSSASSISIQQQGDETPMRYISSSQSGMNFLETRVNGLEMALDEISQNITVSSGSVSDTDSSGNTCYMLPHAEFLSPKFWRKTEGHYSSSRVSFSGRKQLAYVVSDLPDKDADAEKLKPDNPKSRQQNGNDYPRHRMSKKILVPGCSGLDGGSVENFARF